MPFPSWRIALPAGLVLLCVGLAPMQARAEKTIEISLKQRYLTLFDNGKFV